MVEGDRRSFSIFRIGQKALMAGSDLHERKPTAFLGYLLLIFAATVATRLFNLGQLPLTGLEAITLWAAEMNWSGLFHNRIAATHSPFYFALVKLTYSGELVSARLPSAIFDGATAVVLAAIGNRIGGRSGAICATGIFICCPILWDTGQTARPYAALNFGTALLLFGAIAACDRPRDQEASISFDRNPGLLIWLASVAGSLVAVYSTSLGLLSWVAIDAPVLLICFLERRWATARTWLALRAVSIAVWLPLAFQLYKPTASKAASYWVQGGVDRIWVMLEEIWYMHYSLVSGRVVSTWTQPALYVVLPILFVLGASTLWGIRRNALIVLAGLASIPIAAIAIISIHTPLTVARYGQVAALGFVLVASAGLHQLWRHPRPWSKIAAVFAATAIVMNTVDFVTQQRRHDYQPASRIIVEADASNPLFLVSRSYVSADATAYLAKRNRKYFRLDDLRGALAKANSVWLIDLRRGRDLNFALNGLDVQSITITTFPQRHFTLYRIVRKAVSDA